MATGDITLHIDLAALTARIEDLHVKVDRMATQADIDALTTAVNGFASQLSAALTDIRSDIDELKAAGVDTARLEASVARLGQTASDAQALAAENPAPPA